MFGPQSTSTTRSQSPILILCCVLVLFFGFSPFISAGSLPAPYRVVDLGVLPGTTTSVASAINNQGEIVGWSNSKSGTRAFLFTPTEGMVELPALTLGGVTLARDINDAHQIVGSADSVKYGTGRAVIWSDGRISPLGDLGSGNWSEAWAINEAGQVVGTAEVGDFVASAHAFLYEPSTGMIDLTPQVQFAAARGINEVGQVTGWADAPDGSQHAFLYEDKSFTDMGELPGFHTSFGTALDDHGIVVGTAVNASGKGARLFRAAAPEKFEDLSGKNLFAYALATNNLGVVVGYGYGALSTRALVYSDALGMQDLNALISPLEGWVIEAATDVNDFGVIVGYGFNARTRRTHAVRLDPMVVPLPE